MTLIIILGALPSMDGFFAELSTWLLRVITVGGGFFLLIDMAKHLFSTPRDLRGAGIDLAVFAVLLALASQASTIATSVAGLIKVAVGGDFLSAPAPRSLRVRASLQVANTRLPARSFVLLMALLLAGGMAVARGADIALTAEVLGPLAAISITLLEGRWWGYTTWELAMILAAHLARPGRLELSARQLSLPPESAGEPTVRRPRWAR